MTTATITELGGEIVERQVPAGLLRFENYEIGQWLTKKGEPAKKAKRLYTLNGVELPSVSQIVGTIDKPGLVAWAEDMGARGAVQAMRQGESLSTLEPEQIVRKVRALGLGADAVRDAAADRGTAIHTPMHQLATTGEAPNPQDFEPHLRPWMQGATRAWLALDPELVEAETICCHPDLHYAGRPDLIAYVDGKLTLIDYKTSIRGRIYVQAHAQTRLYVEAKRTEGIEIERIIIVAIKDDGGFEAVEGNFSALAAKALVHVYRAVKSVGN